MPKPTPTGYELSSDRARRAKTNSELLQEVMRVLFNAEVGNRAVYGSLVESLNQGASLEGIYNGLAHSAEYREFEKKNPGATPAARKFFAREFLVFQAMQKNPVAPTPKDARPLPVLGGPGGQDLVFQGASTASSPEAKLELLFGQASIYTLKRVLTDESMAALSELKRDPTQLATWYGNWVSHMAEEGVDFGVSLRNKANEGFHRQWAEKADFDRLQWEVLNRLHRVLNALNETARK